MNFKPREALLEFYCVNELLLDAEDNKFAAHLYNAID